MTLINILVPILVALISAGGAYLIARRRNSGNINTTEASVLWEERRLLTQELRSEVAELRQENTHLKVENGKMTKLLEKQDQKIIILENKLAKLP